jgi:hypothetical protein
VSPQRRDDEMLPCARPLLITSYLLPFIFCIYLCISRFLFFGRYSLLACPCYAPSRQAPGLPLDVE